MSILSAFAHHRVAANLLMVIMILSGVYALSKLNVQFFPTFELDRVSVRVIWSGASAEDIEEGITIPLEQALKSVDNIKHMTSTSAQNVASIQLEFYEGTNIILALDKVKQKVDEFRNLPQDAEKPQIENLVRYEGVAKILLSASEPSQKLDFRELRLLANQFERELTHLGIDKVEINGLPDEEINIEIPIEQLQHLDLSLDEVATRINTFSQDMPSGTLGSQHSAKELRSLEQARSEMEFARIPIVSNSTDFVRLGDVSTIKRQPDTGGVLRFKNAQPVVELALKRTEDGNALKAARVFQGWLAEKQMTLPPSVKLEVFDESWQMIRERIYLLLKNGGGGLILVIIILYLFLNARVAFWVAVGIPVSFMATLAILYAAGGTINMISLFGLIMALGIIVDDAIVVGEDALAHYQDGEAPLLAAEGGARRMFVPVIASSLTTIAAFLPLMMVGGIMGNILFDIPLVVICVILASLVESFFVLPGHLRNAFTHIKRGKEEQHIHHSLRYKLDKAFDHFRQNSFRRAVTWSLGHRSIVVALAFSSLIMTLGIVAGGRINFTFFPSPESQIVYANVSFVSGSSREQTEHYLRHMEEKLNETNQQLGGDLIDMAVAVSGSSFSGGSSRKNGEQLGAIFLELQPSDQRSVRNTEIIELWKNKLERPAGIENLTIVSRKTGPPGSDLVIRLTGSDNDQLKQAATELSQALRGIEGVYGIDDDMPYGKEQLIYRLRPAGEILGLTVTDIGQQLRTAFDGTLVQIFQDGANEVEVRVQLPKHERDQINTLERINIRTPAGEFVPLTSVVQWSVQHGFEVLRHAEGELAIEVSAEVNSDVNNANRIIESLEAKTLPELKQKYWINYSFEGRAADQKETTGDMKWGGLLGLALIYIVLTWVFASYGWPLVVMAIIPFGLVGAIWGHWLLDIDLTLLSVFGIFGLSGIVVNDSIILVSFYKRLRDKGMMVMDALIEASVQRLRAVLLTSLTTIAGLLPLLFETSLQAQFLIPMAVSIAFGLALATVLVLIIVPVFLSIHESVHFKTRALFTSLKAETSLSD